MKYPALTKLSDRLKYLRQLHDLSQAELAVKAGTTQQAIQQAEKGKARNPRYLHQLASALDTPIEWVVFGNVEEESITKNANSSGLEEKSYHVLDSFFAMPEKDQQLIYELMKSREKNKS